MRVLIVIGSRHGSTWAIGDKLAAGLEAAGHHVDVSDAGLVDTIDPYEAIVVGSAVYMGKWVPESRQFVERFRDRLHGRPTFVFSSGPVGGIPDTDDAPASHIAACEALLPYSDRVFSGRLYRDLLGWLEKSIVAVTQVPERDDRDWPAIVAWAWEISKVLGAYRPLPESALESTHGFG